MRTLMVGLMLLLLTGPAAVQAQNGASCPRPTIRQRGRQQGSRRQASGRHRRRPRPWQAGSRGSGHERPRRTGDLQHISYFTAPAHDIGVPPSKARVPAAGTITVDGQVFDVPQAVP